MASQANRTPPETSDGTPAGVIMLARHGRPALERKSWLSWRAFETWWDAYDAGGLTPGEGPDPALVAAAHEADMILASPLRRAVETAEAASGGKPVQTDPVFVEARLPPPPLVGVRLRPASWGVVARIAWWLGYAGGQETKPAAEARAHDAADRLEGAAAGGRTVLLCGHGWFNRMIRPVLLARGWRCVRDGGDAYWGLRRYERPGG